MADGRVWWLERSETVVVVVERSRSWAVDFGSWVRVPPVVQVGVTARGGTGTRLGSGPPARLSLLS